MSDWIAAATAYSVHGRPSRSTSATRCSACSARWTSSGRPATSGRGFLIGGTAGRTTLNGEGLQHEDGHSLMISNSSRTASPYDPTFQYEVAVITQDGMRRMHQEQEDVFYYITVMNENYEHPEMPGRRGRHHQGHVRFVQEAAAKASCVQLLGSGTIFREVIAAADLLKRLGRRGRHLGCPSFNELAGTARDTAAGTCCTREAPKIARRTDAGRRRRAR